MYGLQFISNVPTSKHMKQAFCWTMRGGLLSLDKPTVLINTDVQTLTWFDITWHTWIARRLSNKIKESFKQGSSHGSWPMNPQESKNQFTSHRTTYSIYKKQRRSHAMVLNESSLKKHEVRTAKQELQGGRKWWHVVNKPKKDTKIILIIRSRDYCQVHTNSETTLSLKNFMSSLVWAPNHLVILFASMLLVAGMCEFDALAAHLVRLYDWFLCCVPYMSSHQQHWPIFSIG